MTVNYRGNNPGAGVNTVEILPHTIILEFADRTDRYLYDGDKPGLDHVSTMKNLALAGKGLTTYVNQYVRENYAAKLPPRDSKNRRTRKRWH